MAFLDFKITKISHEENTHIKINSTHENLEARIHKAVLNQRTATHLESTERTQTNQLLKLESKNFQQEAEIQQCHGTGLNHGRNAAEATGSTTTTETENKEGVVGEGV